MAAASVYSAVGSGEAVADRPAIYQSTLFGKAKAWVSGLSLWGKVILGTCVIGAIAGIAAGAAGGSKAPPSPPPPFADPCTTWTSYRLPGNVVPTAYTLTWALPISPEGTAFTPGAPVIGSVDILVDVVQPGQCIFLHQVDLNLTGVRVADADSGLVISASPALTYDPLNERVIIRAGGSVGAHLKLSVNFTMAVSANNYGLYASSFSNGTGLMLATQFEATYARHAFPCFDEPALKATFVLRVSGVPAGYTPLSNMPVSSDVGEGPARMVTFLPSLRMSSYLLAFVCGPLVKVSQPNVGSGGITVSGYAVNSGNNINLLGYAVQIASCIIPYYETLFNAPFPLPKMDMVGVPDFAAGAMENWGLITYRETALLANTSINSASELQRVAVVVSHELAHQWFGDLVTMLFWDALWLNEGFASRVEYIGVQQCAPGFGIERQFQSQTVLRALRADAFSDVQQLTQSVTTSAEVEGQFSSISYQKGASVLYQMQAFLAGQGKPGAFFSGVAAYIAAHAYGNAEPSALWSALSTASGLPALAVEAATYELQPGYPVIRVAWADPASETSGRGVLTISQSRFFLTPYSAAAAGAAEAARLYWVPLQFQGGGGPVVAAAAAVARATGGFSTPSWPFTVGTSVTPFDLSTESYVKIGVNGTLYSRVAYPANVWTALGVAAAASCASPSGAFPLSPSDRGSLLDDYFAFALSGLYTGSGITTSAALAFAAAWVPTETAYEGLVAFLSQLSQLSNLITPDVPLASAADTGVDPFDFRAGSEQCVASMNVFVKVALSPSVASLGWNASVGETPLTTQLRASVLSAASAFNVPAVVTRARQIYDAAGGPTSSIPVDVASLVVTSVVRWGGETEFTAVKTAFEAATSASDSRRYLLALCASRDRVLLKDFLGYILYGQCAAGDCVRTGDKVAALVGVASNPFGRSLAWAFAKENWAAISYLYPPGGFDMAGIVGGLASPFTSSGVEYTADVQTFWSGANAATISGALHDLSAAEETVQRAILWYGGVPTSEATATCAWLTTNYPSE